MDNWKLESWADYWTLFDELSLTLTENKKEKIVGELKDAQKYVDGLCFVDESPASKLKIALF